MPHGVILQRTSSAIFKRLYASGLPRRKRFASGSILLHSLQGRRNRMRIQTHAIPTRVAEVRARVAGIVLERSFQQGADVKAGDVLYRIDPVRFEVELKAAEAALAKAQAVHDQAELQAKRVEKLASGQAASQAQYEAAVAAFRQAQADVAARKAAVARW